MKLRILTFGIARDITGSGFLDMEVPEDATVADLESHLRQKYPALNRLASLLIAVNTDYGARDRPLKSTDEIALIPPVSGG